MKELHIYSKREGFKIVDTYIKDKEIVTKIIKDDLVDFLKTLYEQGLFLGHEGESFPHLSRKIIF